MPCCGQRSNPTNQSIKTNGAVVLGNSMQDWGKWIVAIGGVLATIGLLVMWKRE